MCVWPGCLGSDRGPRTSTRAAGRRRLARRGCPLTLAGLRGRFVLLDFWTSRCVNCLHVLAEVHHPALDDPGLLTWSQYAVRAWPTLVLVDPEG